jgi:hypothetical protein
MFNPWISLRLLPAPWPFVFFASSIWLEAAHGAVGSDSAQESMSFGKTRSAPEVADRRVCVREVAAPRIINRSSPLSRVSAAENRETAMMCKPEIKRHCRTRAEAHQYLASRGFLCLPRGWANGRWLARLDSENEGVVVSISLEALQAA